jgi:23S rRNA pseudouridine2605 synthase
MKDAISDCLIDRRGLLPGAAMDDKSKSGKDGDRIAKVIARAGLASRREAEAWIAAGRVSVNGAVISSPALNIAAGDRVSVDGVPLPAPERARLFLYHKPRGLLTSHGDPQGRPTIFEYLPKDLPRLVSVGRLDFNTEGLILLTNDGALARVLELPATAWLRRYRVRAHGSVGQDKLDALRAGVTVEGVHYAPIEATLDRVMGSNLWLTFAIREGKNREVRAVLGHLGLSVTRLIRVSFGPFQLGELAEGAVEEVPTRVLREQLGERVVTLAGTDFSAPIATPPPTEKTADAPAKAAGKTPNKPWQKPIGRKSSDHVWRAREAERAGKKLLRKFRGSRRDEISAPEQPAVKPRADLVADRKGRLVPVERHGEPPRAEQPEPRPGKGPRKRGRRHAPDRSSGARPRHPRGR